jgi:hypothetical protein
MNIYYGEPLEHAQSFVSIQDIIKNEASIALTRFEQLLNDGWTKQEILDNWNEVFTIERNKFKSYNELEKWLRKVGI